MIVRMLKLSDKSKRFFTELRFAYFGTGEFAVRPLEKLLEVGARPLVVITTPDAPAGRERKLTPSPIGIAAAAHGCAVQQPEKLDEAFAHAFTKLKPDVALLADYGKIVPSRVLAIPRLGFLNIHPSLLPKYRGATPLQGALLDGTAETGVTIINMDEKIDHGPVVARQKTALRAHETAATLEKRLAALGGQMLLRTLPRYMKGNIVPVPQRDDDATFTRLLGREDGKLSFAHSAAELERRVRAFTPWPGTYAVWKTPDGEKRLRILEAKAAQAPKTLGETSCGTVLAENGTLRIVTAQGLLEIYLLQLEGKTPVTPKDFLNGYPGIEGTVLL